MEMSLSWHPALELMEILMVTVKMMTPVLRHCVNQNVSDLLEGGSESHLQNLFKLCQKLRLIMLMEC